MGLLVCMVSMVCNDKSIQENCANFIMNMWPVSAVIIVGEALNTRAHTYTHTSVITHTHTHTYIYIYIYIYIYRLMWAVVFFKYSRFIIKISAAI